MKRIKAVTLIELLIVLMLLSFTMGIGFYAFSVIKKQVFTFIKERRELQLNKELQYFLERDFDECQLAFLEGDSSLVLAGEEDTLTYRFATDKIIRAQQTLNFEYPCKLEEIQTTTLIAGNKTVITHFKLSFTNTLRYQLEFRKVYAADQLINNTE